MSRNSAEDLEGGRSIVDTLVDSWKKSRDRILVVLGFLIAAIAITIAFGLGPGLSAFLAPDTVAVGKISPSDIIAERRITFVDQKATKLRVEAEQRLALPIFAIDPKVGRAALDNLASFSSLISNLVTTHVPQETLFLQVQRLFPGLFTRQEISTLLAAPSRAQDFADVDAILARVLDRGIIALPATGLESYSGEYLELRRGSGPMADSMEMQISEAITLRNLGDKVVDEEVKRRVAKTSMSRVAALVEKFAVENAFFDVEASSNRLEKAVKQVEPVTRTIAPGERLLRKGMIISDNDYAKYLAAREALARPDWQRVLGDSAFLAILVVLSIFLLGQDLSGAKLDQGETILAAAGIFVSWLLAVLVARGVIPFSDLPLVGFVVPGALLCLILAVFVGQRFSLLYGLCLSLFLLVAANYDARAFVFSFMSTSAAVLTVRHAESRIDLVKAGLRLGVVEAIGAVLLSLPFAGELRDLAAPLVYGGGNGFLSALLALGAFPVLEQALNAPTRFRLIELSDLNAPALQRLLAVAPGTYSHSVAVAHLAEAACRAIGADPLLARVGAYYHDIGKIEQPEYFVENQVGYNRHDEINPRLSATVIRSHVKLGIEKARALGLPDEVVAIVAEHHGNGLISWFFDRANREEEADPEDFSYPGRPPASREAAVIMLADAAEAAVRSLKKPTPGRIDALLKEIVLDRFKQGQLDRCDLTFGNLETIRASFTKVLVGQHHARIEYPRTKEENR